jgi:soluble lytic murein transglycosylase-like protein
MSRRRPTALAGAALGALAFGATLLAPRPLADGLRPAAEPGPPGWVEQVDARLALRIPELVAGDRRRLARTLVGDADAARIDPLLVLALIEIESAYDPAAISNRGARGLMQLRGPTLRREAERSGLDWRDPHDPIVNVQAGIRYLRRLLDAFGREELALMAYNAGPNRILGYLRAGEIPERFHAYPRKVMAEASRLRRAFGPLRTAIALAPARPGALPE